MNRPSFLAHFPLLFAFLVGFAIAPISIANPPEEDFEDIPGTIFQKRDSNGDSLIDDADEFFVSLDVLVARIQSSTQTDPPGNDYYPINSPCLNRIANELHDWIGDIQAANPTVKLPGDPGWSKPLHYDANFLKLLEFCLAESSGLSGCDFDPNPDDGAGGQVGGGAIGQGSGGGFDVNPDPDPASEQAPWDLDDFADFFEEEPSDCKETFRWLLNQAMIHYPDGMDGGSGNGLDVDFDDNLKQIKDAICGCPDAGEQFASCQPVEPAFGQPCSDTPFACPEDVFGYPLPNINECYAYAASIAYQEVVKYNLFPDSTSSCDCADYYENGDINQLLRDIIAGEFTKALAEAAGTNGLFGDCPPDCEATLGFAAAYAGFGITMSGADYDFLEQLGGCNDCSMPPVSALGVLNPQEPAGHWGTGTGGVDFSFRCDRDADGQVTPMDALLFARSTMRGDESATNPGAVSMARIDPSPCDDGTGAYRAYFQAYSQYDWAEQFMTNAQLAGCDLGACGTRDEFISGVIELFDRYADELDLPPGYNPAPPGIEETSRPREGEFWNGISFPEDTDDPNAPCPERTPDKPLKAKYLTFESDEAEGDIEDVDETLTETCPPQEEAASTEIVSSPPARMAAPDDSDNPIRLTTGEKIESAVDLVIPLSGKDFRLVRNYRSLGALEEHTTSNPTPFDGFTGSGLVGNLWNMPLTMWVDEEFAGDPTDPRVALYSASGAVDIRLNSLGNEVWGRWRSQRTQRFIATWSPVISFDGETVSGHWIPVWRLVEPGAYTLEFYRGKALAGGPETGEIHEPADHQAGLLLRRIDAAGNIWQFIYDDYMAVTGAPGPEVIEAVDSRPIGIRFLQAPNGGSSLPVPMAELQFIWDKRENLDLPGSPLNVNYGKLREAKVLRFEDGEFAPSVVTQRVLYTYYNSLYPSTFSQDLGSDGDLVQVTKLTRVDGPTAEDELWRTQITQYRYHDGTYNTSDELDLSTENPWTLYGHKHALKAVIYPEQIERFAYEQSTSSEMAYIGNAALTLLGMDDFLSSSTTRHGLKWAGKVITKYEPVFSTGSTIDYSQPFRVREQILSAGCGCGNSPETDTRLTYDYHDFRAAVAPFTSDELVWSVHVTEWNLDGSNWLAQTAMLYDYVQRNDTDERLRMQHVVLAAPLDPSTGDLANADFWVTRYEFDRRPLPFGAGNLPRDFVKAILYPSAMLSYTPANANATPTPQQPSYTPRTDAGLVVAFDHNIDGRLTGEWVREGWSPINDGSTDAAYLSSLSAYTKVRKIDRPLLSTNSAYFRGFFQSITDALPIKETVFSDAAGTVGEEIEYGFGLQATSFDYSVGQRIVGMAQIVRAAAVEENGSGSTGITEATCSVVFFDETGEVQYTIDPNDSLTSYTRQASTGRVLSVTANEDAALHTLPSPTWIGTDPGLSGFVGRHDDGGSLTTEITRDALGRITTVTAPGGIKSSIVRSINPWEHTDPTNANAIAYSYYTETTLPHYFDDGGTVVFTGTASRTWFNAGGTALGAESYELDPATAVLSSGVADHDAFRFSFGFANSGAAVTRSVTRYSDFGLLELTAVWPDLSAFSDRLSAAGSTPEPIKPRVSEFTYDYRGNLVETLSPDGSIQTVEYDILDRPVAISLGTDTDPVSGNMVTVRQMWYDHVDSGGVISNGVGDGHLTLVRESPTVNPGDDRVTEMRYDYRGRLISVINPQSPHAFFEYDNLDRTTTAMLFDESSGIPSGLTPPSTTARLSKIDFYYDSQGRPFRRSVAIDPTGITAGTLDEFMWYDPAGQAIAAQTPSAPKVKMRYDGLGRLVRSYVTADTGEINPTVSGSYADTYDAANYSPNLSGDVVYEQTEYDYIETGTIGLGQLKLVTSRSRLHGTPNTTTGALGNGTASINSYSGYYYDAASRLVHTVEFGTNDGATTNRFIANTAAPDIDQADSPNLFATVPASLPTELKDALISSRRFDNRGRPVETLSPWRTESTAGSRTRSLVFYNDLNELVGSIENAKANGSGDPAIVWSSNDRYAPAAGLGDYSPERSRAMSFNRNRIGQVTERMAWRDASNAQTTLYEYAHDIANYGLATDLAVNWLVRRVNYPDETSGDPDPTNPNLSEEFAYNRLGELRASLDQNSTQHTYTRDKLGRVILDAATISPASGIDTSVLALKYTFDNAGRLQKVTSHSDLVPSVANTLNAMRYTYDSLWRLTQIEQNPLGDIGSNPSTGIVDIEYEDVAFNSASTFGTHNITRATDLKYPLGAQGASAARTVLTNTYGPAAGLNDIISRATGFQWNRASTGQTQTVAVERLGLAAPVKIEYGVPDLALDRIQADPLQFPSSITEYKGLDRFGRIISQRWIQPGRDHTTEQSNIAFGYTYNRIGNITERTDDRISAGFAFRDESYEFDELDRLVGMERTPSGSSPFEMDWTLDTFGNWSSFAKTSPGSTFTESRTHNEANELVQTTVGSASRDLTFDHAGNLILQELTASSSREFVYDAWNRLVQVGYDTGTGTQERVRYRYYPDGERAASLVDTSIKAPILPDELNLFFYDASWRLLEIRSDRTSRSDWAFPDTSASFTLSNTRQFIWGEQYIDELVAFMSDTAAAINTDGTLSTGPTFATLEYALTDRNFSVIGRGDTSNALGDRIHYDPYGTFRAYPGGDVNRDGTTNSKDEASISAFILSGTSSSSITVYQAEYDLDLDGDVDSRDISQVSTYGTRTIKSGQLSDRGNIVGWCGYLYEEATGMWLARHRWQIPELGRWANRDPIGYAGGGQNVYQYANGNPYMYLDPLGLQPEGTPEEMMPRWIRYAMDLQENDGIRRAVLPRWLEGKMVRYDPDDEFVIQIFDPRDNTWHNYLCFRGRPVRDQATQDKIDALNKRLMQIQNAIDSVRKAAEAAKRVASVGNVAYTAYQGYRYIKTLRKIYWTTRLASILLGPGSAAWYAASEVIFRTAEVYVKKRLASEIEKKIKEAGEFAVQEAMIKYQPEINEIKEQLRELENELFEWIGNWSNCEACPCFEKFKDDPFHDCAFN